jgi:hypothetical protein
LVVVHDGKKPWYLVTSVLDEKRLSNKQVAEIYRLRWGIEMSHPDYPSSGSLYPGSRAA